MKRRDFLEREPQLPFPQVSFLEAFGPTVIVSSVQRLPLARAIARKQPLSRNLPNLHFPSNMKHCPRTLSPRPSACFSTRSDAHSDR